MLRATGLLDSDVEESFDRLTRLAVRLVGVPAAFISLVDENRDFYKSACGFGEPLATSREITGQTFCHFTIQSHEPLVIPDTKADPLYRDVPTVKSLGVAAYVGIPLVVEGQVIGAFCSIDFSPRQWTERDVDTLRELAAITLSEIGLRAATRRSEEANRSKSAFLATMSHELRTPLNAIGGYAELIEMELRGPVTSMQRSDLERIQRSQRHLLGLINGILNYAKMDAGMVHYRKESVRVDEVLTTCESLTAPQMSSKSLVYLPASIAPGLLASGDGEKVQQIVLNLFSNAVKFTPAGGSISTMCLAHDGRIEISVTDTGVGINPDSLERIFEPFVQLDSTLTRDYPGTGLGLAISRDLARGMDGDLTAASVRGKGSTFTLWLPAQNQY